MARLMLNRLAFGDSYSSRQAPIELAFGDELWGYPKFEAPLRTAGFLVDQKEGLITLQLPGDFREIKAGDEYDRAVKEMPFGWCGVLDVNGGRREPSFIELYRNGDMLARISEVDMPAGVAVELAGESEGAPQLLVPFDETSTTLDDLYRRVLLQILNDPEFPSHVS